MILPSFDDEFHQMKALPIIVALLVKLDAMLTTTACLVVHAFSWHADHQPIDRQANRRSFF